MHAIPCKSTFCYKITEDVAYQYYYASVNWNSMMVMSEKHINGIDTYMLDMRTKPVILSNNPLTVQLPELGDHL